MKISLLLPLFVCGFSLSLPSFIKSEQSSPIESDTVQISTPIDLINLSASVNSGNSFQGKRIELVQDLDMSGYSMEPIGTFGSGSYFYGTLDGEGHTISNLSIHGSGNIGLFGMLGGTLMNLGIESGEIVGTGCCGAFSSHAAALSAKIINCFNRASVSGARAGGIVDNFIGSVINCWSDCELTGDAVGGISSYEVDQAAFCYSTKPLFANPQQAFIFSGTIGHSDLESKQMAEKLTNNALCNLYSEVDFHQLNSWNYSENTKDIAFDSKKVTLTSSNFLYYLLNNIVVIFPMVILIGAVLSFSIALAHHQKKTN
jgi:hypothetical protein